MPKLAPAHKAGVFHILRNPTERPILKLSFNGPIQKGTVDIGSQDERFPARQSIPKVALQEDGKGVRLGPDGAAGAPNAQLALGLIFSDQRRQDDVAERFKMLLVPEEIRLPNGQFDR